jgi:tripartite-type tricarboxylate transporter receptor subunit TctC
MLKLAAKIDFVHVPYKGLAPAMTDLLGGHVDMMFDNLTNALPQVRDGTVKALAVAGATRARALPETPTMAEAGYRDFAMGTWYGISAPAETPREIVGKLHAAIARTLNTPKVRDTIEAQGAEVFVKDPEAFAAFLHADAKLMRELIKRANMTAN